MSERANRSLADLSLARSLGNGGFVGSIAYKKTKPAEAGW